MPRRLTITLTEEVYEGLHRRVPRREISNLIEDLVRLHILGNGDLEAGYQAMAADVEREQEALEWIEAVPDEALE